MSFGSCALCLHSTKVTNVRSPSCCRWTGTPLGCYVHYHFLPLAAAGVACGVTDCGEHLVAEGKRLRDAYQMKQALACFIKASNFGNAEALGLAAHALFWARGVN